MISLLPSIISCLLEGVCQPVAADGHVKVGCG